MKLGQEINQIRADRKHLGNTHVTDRPPPGRRVPRRNSSTGGGRPGGRCRTGYWRDLQGGSGDSGGHGGSEDSGGHGGSGSSVALALGPATQAEDICPPSKKFLGEVPLWGAIQE